MYRITPSSSYLDQLKQRLAYQFFLTKEELNKFLPPNIEIEFSKKTKRLRYIYLEDKLWGIIRPRDGFFLLTPNSAKFLNDTIPFPKIRVIIQSDVSEFIQKGRNVFAKHVVDCDPTLIPSSEVMIVNENKILLAIGKTILNKEEMLSFNEGVAVKVRKGIE